MNLQAVFYSIGLIALAALFDDTSPGPGEDVHGIRLAVSSS